MLHDQSEIRWMDTGNRTRQELQLRRVHSECETVKSVYCVGFGFSQQCTTGHSEQRSSLINSLKSPHPCLRPTRCVLPAFPMLSFEQASPKQ